LAQNPSFYLPPEDFEPDEFRPDELWVEEGDRLNVDDLANNAPSLPVILLSAASGIGAGIVALYVAYRGFGLNIYWSAAVATLTLSAGLGISGAVLSSAIGSRAALSNIFFSCGLIVATLLFFAFCTLIGAIAATLFFIT
jgi:hypothetical protein